MLWHMLMWVWFFDLNTGTGIVYVKKQAKSLLFFSNFSWWNTHLKKNGPKEFLTIRDVLEIFPCTFTSYDNTSSFCTRWMLCCVCAFSIASLAKQTLACLSYIVGLLVRIRLANFVGPNSACVVPDATQDINNFLRDKSFVAFVKKAFILYLNTTGLLFQK